VYASLSKILGRCTRYNIMWWLRSPVPYPLGHGGVYKRRLNNECLLCSLYNNTFSFLK
jgi:hypothetical protein